MRMQQVANNCFVAGYCDWSSVLLQYFWCRWAGVHSEGLSTSIKLSELCMKFVLGLRVCPSTPTTRMMVSSWQDVFTAPPAAMFVVWSFGAVVESYWSEIRSQIGCHMCGPTITIFITMSCWPIFLQSSLLPTPPIPTCDRGAARGHLIPPTHLNFCVAACIGRVCPRGGGLVQLWIKCLSKVCILGSGRGGHAHSLAGGWEK